MIIRRVAKLFENGIDVCIYDTSAVSGASQTICVRITVFRNPVALRLEALHEEIVVLLHGTI